MDTTPAIQLLLQAGADLTAKNVDGMTPLIYSLQKHEQNRRNIATLIRYSTEQEVNEADSMHRTPLHHLARMKKSWDHGFLTEITKVLYL